MLNFLVKILLVFVLLVVYQSAANSPNLSPRRPGAASPRSSRSNTSGRTRRSDCDTGQIRPTNKYKIQIRKLKSGQKYKIQTCERRLRVHLGSRLGIRAGILVLGRFTAGAKFLVYSEKALLT